MLYEIEKVENPPKSTEANKEPVKSVFDIIDVPSEELREFEKETMFLLLALYIYWVAPNPPPTKIDLRSFLGNKSHEKLNVAFPNLKRDSIESLSDALL